MKLPVFAILATVISGCTAVPAAAAIPITDPVLLSIQSNMRDIARSCFRIGQLTVIKEVSPKLEENIRKACFLGPNDPIQDPTENSGVH